MKYFEKAISISGTKKIQECLLDVAKFASTAHLPVLADQALAQSLSDNGPGTKPYICLSQIEFQRKNYAAAIIHLKDSLKINSNESEIWAALGHLYFKQRKFNEAKVAYETALNLNSSQNDLIYNRLGEIYLREAYPQSVELISQQFSAAVKPDISLALIAKDLFLKSCALKPSCQNWLGVGKACLAVGDFEDAEDAFAVRIVFK